jgi:hypothetical protein
MRKSFHDGLAGLAPAGAFLLLLAGVAGAAPSDAPAARVTAAVGDTASAGTPLDPRGSLAEGAEIDTGDDGGCSLLVDEDAVMELCAGTEVRLERKDGDPKGARVVDLERGELRLVVEPRLGEERIEVHTPAAIATILGTIVHVAVDALGVTTVTSSHARVLVESAAAGVKGATTVSEGEQAVVEPGRAPSPARRLSADQKAALGGCLIDFHEATLGHDRRNQLDSAIDEAVREAMDDAGRVDVAAGVERFTPLLPRDPRPGPPQPNVGPPPVLDPVSTGAGNEALAEIMSDDSTGGGIGGGGDGGDIPGVP